MKGQYKNFPISFQNAQILVFNHTLVVVLSRIFI